ncbi:MAG: hypothetical protein GX631_01790 [Dehalococcoidales bacterium]|nr:hypothetical protein [Dehalococcoidales bacterium]
MVESFIPMNSREWREMQKHNRIHVFGASGAGTTTLGKALAERLHIRHLDTDDFFWMKTEIPYQVPRPTLERIGLLKKELKKETDWVLSGAVINWGNFAIPLFTLAVFLWIPHNLRMQRLQEREIMRYGIDAISPGGWFYRNHCEFMEWAARYDTAGSEMRSSVQQEEWSRLLPCRLLRFTEPLTTADMAGRIISFIDTEKR